MAGLPLEDGIEIERAGAPAVRLLAALHGASFAEAWSAEMIARLLAMPGSFALIARAGEAAAVGFVLARVAGDEAEILSIGVVPEARRRGIGCRLVAGAGGAAAAEGARSLFLEVAASNRAGRALYAGLGFRRVGLRRGYYRTATGGGDTALVLRADLPLRPHMRVVGP